MKISSQTTRQRLPLGRAILAGALSLVITIGVTSAAQAARSGVTNYEPGDQQYITCPGRIDFQRLGNSEIWLHCNAYPGHQNENIAPDPAATPIASPEPVKGRTTDGCNGRRHCR
jgi:hypothetical protein